MLGNYQEFTGRAAEQTEEFLKDAVEPCLEKHKDLLGDYDTSLSV
jgi:adenylosuccinate lyase